MAYITKLVRFCDWAMCEREAHWRVSNRMGADMGVYCHDHATKRKREVDRMERKSRVRG